MGAFMMEVDSQPLATELLLQISIIYEEMIYE